MKNLKLKRIKPLQPLSQAEASEVKPLQPLSQAEASEVKPLQPLSQAEEIKLNRIKQQQARSQAAEIKSKSAKDQRKKIALAEIEMLTNAWEKMIFPNGSPRNPEDPPQKKGDRVDTEVHGKPSKQLTIFNMENQQSEWDLPF